MKILVLLLLLANMTLFMWEYKSGAVNITTMNLEQHNEALQEKILLVSELNPALANREAIASDTDVLANTDSLKTPIIAPADNNKSHIKNPALANSVTLTKSTKSATNTITKTEKAEVTHCYEVGPFSHDNIYTLWLKQVAEFKKTVHLYSNNKQTPASHLVYYPITESINIELAVQFLKSHGVTDFYRLRDGDYKGSLSLGVFKNESNAVALQQRLLNKGIHAQLKPLYKTEAQRYAFIKGSADIVNKTTKFKKTYNNLTIKDKSCP